MSKRGEKQDRKMVIYRQPKSEMKQFSSQMAAAILAASSWTTFGVFDAIVNGNTGSTRVGKKIRVHRIVIYMRWLPFQVDSTLAHTLNLVKDRGAGSAAYTLTDLGAELVVGVAAPLGADIVRGSPTALLGGQWSTGEEVSVLRDWRGNLVVEYDANNVVRGHEARFGLNTDVTLSQYNIYRAVWFTDE